MTIKGIKGVLTKAEYIGYLKGKIIDSVAVGAITGLDVMITELRIAIMEQENADTPLTIPDPPARDPLTDTALRAIRDSMLRLDKK